MKVRICKCKPSSLLPEVARTLRARGYKTCIEGSKLNATRVFLFNTSEVRVEFDNGALAVSSEVKDRQDRMFQFSSSMTAAICFAVPIAIIAIIVVIIWIFTKESENKVWSTIPPQYLPPYAKIDDTALKSADMRKDAVVTATPVGEKKCEKCGKAYTGEKCECSTNN